MHANLMEELSRVALEKWRWRSRRDHSWVKVGRDYGMWVGVEKVLVMVIMPTQPPPELLSLSSLVVLKPVEHILPLYPPIVREVSCYLLYLCCIWCPHPTSIHLLKYHELLWCWAPSR